MLPILLLAAAAAAPQTPIDAERAFASDAKTIGQWTAFRKWSTDDAVMFVPQPVNTHEFLKNRKDPATVIDWWPTASYISCDGTLAVNTGGWTLPGGAGYFSTIWQRQPDGGWKWVADSGDGLETARVKPAEPTVTRASCRGKPLAEKSGNLAGGDNVKGINGSKDGTLSSGWTVGKDGSRSFYASIWTGKGWKKVIDDTIAGSPPNK